VLVEEAPPRKRDEGVNDACGVPAPREDDEVGTGADGKLRRRHGPLAPEDRDRVGDGDALKPVAAKQPVGRRVERRPAPEPEAPVEGVSHHHALGSARDRPPEGAELGGQQPRLDVGGLVGRDPRRAEAGKVLRTGSRVAGGQATGEGESERRPAEMARPQGAACEIDHRREVDVDPGFLQPLRGRLPGAEGFGRAPVRRGRPGRRQSVEGARGPALLVDEEERAPRPRKLLAPLLQEDAGDALGRG
jgi:hypothetical protein